MTFNYGARHTSMCFYNLIIFVTLLYYFTLIQQNCGNKLNELTLTGTMSVYCFTLLEVVCLVFKIETRIKL